MATPSEAPQGHIAVTAGPRHNGPGVAALILGIVALVLCVLWIVALPIALIAVVLGVIGRRRAARVTAVKKGIATAGLVVGILAALLSGGLGVFGIAAINSDSGKDYQACLDKAHSSQQREKCAHDFGRRLTH
jgi:hypothetical protein